MPEELEQTNVTLNFVDALKALDKVSTENFVSKIWIPSKQTEVQVKEINAKQQKKLLQSALEELTTRASFTEIFYNILSENILDKEVLKTLTSVDKISLALGMRNQISNKLTVEIQEDPQVTQVVDLNQIMLKFKNLTHPSPKPIAVGDIVIEVSVPTIESEIKFEQLQTKNKQTNEVEMIKATIVEAFLIETSKYVTKMVINGIDVNLSPLTAAQKVNLVEKLPANAIQNILEYIAELKQNIDNVLMVHNEEYKVSKPITIDSSLYLNI
jgi:hypothetical protein